MGPRMGQDGHRAAEAVLLVEDDDFVRRALTRVLANAGYFVLSAPDLAAALRLADDHAHPIAVLLTDLVLPDGTGLELIERMSVRHPGVRVILASGYPDAAAAGYGVPARPVCRLPKPFTPGEILDAVRAAIDAR